MGVKRKKKTKTKKKEKKKEEEEKKQKTNVDEPGLCSSRCKWLWLPNMSKERHMEEMCKSVPEELLAYC